MFWGGKFFLFLFFKDIVASALKSCINEDKKKLYNFFLNLMIQFKLELSPHNFHNKLLLWLHLGCNHLIPKSSNGFVVNTL